MRTKTAERRVMLRDGAAATQLCGLLSAMASTVLAEQQGHQPWAPPIVDGHLRPDLMSATVWSAEEAQRRREEREGRAALTRLPSSLRELDYPRSSRRPERKKCKWCCGNPENE